MRAAYLRYYQRYTPLASLHFACDALRARSRARRMALLNRQRDYLRLSRQPRRLALHRQLNSHLLASAEQSPHPDHGEGYFCQGLDAIGITGLRDTRARMNGMQLHRRLAGRRVLEIGCNCGFLSVCVAGTARHVRAFDVNPHYIKIAGTVAAELGTDNVHFRATTFEALVVSRPYDAILSFGNHGTFDGNPRQSLQTYFDRCHRLLEPGGLLLFESHASRDEHDRLPTTLALLAERFDITEQHELTDGSYLDRGRTFVVARRRTDERLAARSRRHHRPAEMLAP